MHNVFSKNLVKSGVLEKASKEDIVALIFLASNTDDSGFIFGLDITNYDISISNIEYWLGIEKTSPFYLEKISNGYKFPNYKQIYSFANVSGEPKSWTAEAGDAWRERSMGEAPFSRIGRALGPLVALHGWPAVKPAWARYLAVTSIQFLSPERFAQTFGQWYVNKEKVRDRIMSFRKVSEKPVG